MAGAAPRPAIRWTIAQSALGPMLLAANPRGICRLSFDEDECELHRRFPDCSIERDEAGLAPLVGRVLALIDRPREAHGLPLDTAGSPFQQAVWRELGRISPGKTATYAELAARVGNPGAVRAVGSACGANPVAVLVPCHRALRSDGGLGGYAWGLERKRQLLAAEAQPARP